MLTWVDDFTHDYFGDGTYTSTDVAWRPPGLQFVDFQDLRSPLPPGWTSARIWADFTADDSLPPVETNDLAAFLGFTDADTSFPSVTSNNGWTAGIFNTPSAWDWEVSYNDVTDSGDGLYESPGRPQVESPFTVAVTVTIDGTLTIEAGSYTETVAIPAPVMAALGRRANLCPMVHANVADVDVTGMITRWGYEIIAPTVPAGIIGVGLATSAHCPVGP